MVSKKIMILYLIAFSVLFTYVMILIWHYPSIPKTIVTHIDITGKPDAFGEKYHLWIATGVNALLLLFIGLAIKNPHRANIPVEITAENKEKVYRNYQLFLSILGIITSGTFSYMIINAIGNFEVFTYLLAYLILSPIVVLVFFKDSR